jgi:3-methyl-2-oxobutanoate hydroxymethyltransferase
MPEPLKNRITLSDLRAARRDGRKIPMLTCYDYTTAGLMQEAGVQALLVGDSAANVILGYDTTVRTPLRFMIEIAAAVRRGAPLAFVVADMPFGSYQASAAQGVKNTCRMLKYSGCDCVKLEVGPSHLELIRRLADGGVAVMAHLGLRPQSVNLMGGYKFQGRTAAEAERIVDLAAKMEQAGAAMLLLEAVPAEVAQAVVERTELPVIGCGAGPACHGSVFVTHDALGLTLRPPRFAPSLGNLAGPLRDRFAEYVRRVTAGEYPAAEHGYPMPEEEKARFVRGTRG